MTYVMGKKELFKLDHLYLMNLLVNCFIFLLSSSPSERNLVETPALEKP